MLSQNATDALNIIYKAYLDSRSSSGNCYKLFTITALFHNTDIDTIMPVLIELSKNKLIRLFSDKRLMLREEAFIYLEKPLSNNLFHQTYFAT